MPNGPGKYDDACTAAREATEGRVVLLVVLGGKSGPGFAVQSTDGPLGVMAMSSTLLAIVNQLRDDADAELRRISAQIVREHFGDTP